MKGASVRLYGRHIGTLKVERGNKLSFVYTKKWADAVKGGVVGTHALSMAMPVTSLDHDDEVAGPFFDGVLPDNMDARKRLASFFQVDATDDYGLLFNLGRELPGAVTVEPPDMREVEEKAVRPEFDPLDEDRLAEHIARFSSRPLFVDPDGEVRMSLPGMHHKAAVIYVNGGVALPRGRTPTSHILKVDIDGLPDSIRVENFCLHLAGRLGMNVPKSKVLTAHGKPYMIISRYDRALVAGPSFSYIRRLHQEDFCQCLGFFPRQKYEKEGGPGWKQSFELMNRTSDPIRARAELLSRAIGQFLWFNPDAHAKNYAILYGRARTSLSPLYDLNNAAAFRSNFKATRARVAMFVGGERDPTNIGPEEWVMFARDNDMWPEDVLDRLYDMAEKMPVEVAKLREDFKGTPGDTPLLDIVVADIQERCGNVLSWREQPKRAFA